MASLELQRFPEELHTQLKVIAARLQTSLRSVVIAALAEFVDRQGKEVITRTD